MNKNVKRIKFQKTDSVERWIQYKEKQKINNALLNCIKTATHNLEQAVWVGNQ